MADSASGALIPAFKVPGSTGDSAQRQGARPASEQHYKTNHDGTERWADLNCLPARGASEQHERAALASGLSALRLSF